MNDRTTARRRTRKPAFAATPAVGFALFDAEFRLAAWNASFAALRGYPRRLVKAGTPLESFVRFDAERGEYGTGSADASARRRLAALKRTAHTDREVALPDGRALRIGSERLAGGGLLVSCQDVTAERDAAHRLRQSDERYDFAMRAISEGMYDWDIANDAIHYSARVRAVLGLSAEELGSPMAWRARVHPDDLARYDACHVAHFKGETERFECDYRYRARDGNWHWARQHGVALRDARGRAYRMIGSTGDITELKERERQLAEHAAEQTAVRELLEAISRSAFDLDAVLRTLIESAGRLCRADKAFIFRLEGDAYRLALDYGGVAQTFRDFIARHPIRAGRDTLVGRTALTRSVVHIEDVLADPEYRWPQSQRIGGQRSMLGVPIFRDDVVVGVIALWKERVEPFTPAQIQLVSTFSSQASIAIENARLFSETKEALEQQTATAGILKVISSSPTDVQPVLDRIVESAARLCDARDSQIFLVREGALELAASHAEFPTISTDERFPIDRGLAAARALIDRAVVHVADLESAEAKAEFPVSARYQERYGTRTMVAMPLLREGAPIGVIRVRRLEVRPFTDKQIALLKTFADQAVIAIENVRLFNELQGRNRELTGALDREKATAEILRVIGSSPTNIQPVLDAVAERAGKLCDAPYANVMLVEGDQLQVVSDYSPEPGPRPDRRNFVPLRRGYVNARAVLDREVVHIPDIVPLMDTEFPDIRRNQQRFGFRAMLVVPLLREGRAVGTIFLWRREPGPFSGDQVALLQTFADQAVIAIENVRLFNETKEALERQTATAEILKVISSSPTDVQPVFDAIVKSGVQLFQSVGVSLRLVKGDRIERAAFAAGPGCEVADDSVKPAFPLDDRSVTGRAVLRREVVHVPDVFAESWVGEGPKQVAERMGWRSIAAAPMLREGNGLGAIMAFRAKAGPFSDKELELLRTFADQAVIAIENVRLFNELGARNRELTESLEQQTATAEILKVISSSPTDIRPVLDAVAGTAAKLCDASDAVIFRVDGDLLRRVAKHGESIPAVALDEGLPLDRRTVNGRAAVERRTIHVHDLAAADEAEYPLGRAFAKRDGFRTALATPLLREGQALGTIHIRRSEVRPFSDKQIKLLEVFASQAAIAIENVRLFNELQARNRELTEALEQQTATAEILKVISSSPTDIQPVLEALAITAARLCDASDANIFRLEGDILRRAVSHGPLPITLRVGEGLPVDRGWVTGRCVIDRRTIHIEDFAAVDASDFPISRAMQRETGFRTLLATPLLREGQAIGAIAIRRTEVRPFSHKQIKLLETFANQAVIAIENVRLFNELQARNRDLSESLEQQTATAEILGVISSSPTDVQPVFEALAKSAARLCDAPDVVIIRADGESMRFAASVGPFGQTFGPELAVPIARGSVAGRAVLERRTVHVDDLAAESEDEYRAGKELQRRYGHRTMVAAPLLLGDTVLGAIAMLRKEVRPFSDKQLALLRTFADQAVIAIQNVRLFNETKEALERQRAMADVLASISGSLTDTQPVFERIVKNLRQLFGTRFAVLQILQGDTVEMPAVDGDPGFERLRERYPRPLDDTTVGGRAMLSKTTLQFAPVLDNPATPQMTVQFAKDFGFNSVIFTPMIHEGTVIGAIGAAHPGAQGFDERQVGLIRSFADQAVIAIQNVRLFNETKEALDRQTATAEILRVLSSSPTDTQPVFDAILQKATALCDADTGALLRYDGAVYHPLAVQIPDPAFAAVMAKPRPHPPGSMTGLARLARERRPVHIPNLLDDAAYRNREPSRMEAVEIGGMRTWVGVPMLKDGEVVGAIMAYRKEVRPFDERQIALLQTFADQAVIAIENVRLFNETKEALDHQKASAEVLQVISSSVADTKPVFDKILESCERLFAGRNVGIALVGEDGQIHVIAYHGPGGEEVMRQFPVPLSAASGSGSAILQRRVMHYPDVAAPGVPEYARHGSQRMGIKALLIAPMLWEGRGIGVTFVGRATVGEFSEKEIALLKTFADQAVIAIQNARLFHEIRDKSHQLEIANQHKSAFLANMSHELRTPLNAVIGFSEMLAARYFGDLTDKQDEYVKDIHASGKHLLSLINDILDLSKIEAGRMELEAAEFDLRGALDNALTLVRERAQRGGVALTLEADPAIGPFKGDERKLKQVVLNLLSNAVKFTPRGGAVSVTAKRVDGVAEIAVSDTGVGIAPQDQEAIFEAFRQVGSDVTRKREGTGLGLALARRFVELHGGTIRVESALGQGSTFTVRLPIRHGE